MFLHREDMEPLDTHGKEGVDMIVPMDTVECEKAGSDSLLAACVYRELRPYDYVTESPNVSGDDRSVLPLADPARLAVQVEEPT
jgi:hypothetical protein